MAQTTDGTTFVNAQVQISTDDGATWTDISGWGSFLSVDGGERPVAEQHTFEGDTPIQFVGKRGSVTVNVRVVYTDVADDPYDMIMDEYESSGGGSLDIRWDPDGLTVGEEYFETNDGRVLKPAYPTGEAQAEPAVVLCEFSIAASSVSRSAYS